MAVVAARTRRKYAALGSRRERLVEDWRSANRIAARRRPGSTSRAMRANMSRSPRVTIIRIEAGRSGA